MGPGGGGFQPPTVFGMYVRVHLLRRESSGDGGTGMRQKGCRGPNGSRLRHHNSLQPPLPPRSSLLSVQCSRISSLSSLSERPTSVTDGGCGSAGALLMFWRIGDQQFRFSPRAPLQSPLIPPQRSYEPA